MMHSVVDIGSAEASAAEEGQRGRRRRRGEVYGRVGNAVKNLHRIVDGITRRHGEGVIWQRLTGKRRAGWRYAAGWIKGEKPLLEPSVIRFVCAPVSRSDAIQGRTDIDGKIATAGDRTAIHVE